MNTINELLLDDLAEFMLKEADNGAETQSDQPFRGLDIVVSACEVVESKEDK